MNQRYKEYKSLLTKIADINASISVLNWDREVNMPKKGASLRAQQISTLSGIAHELFTDEKTGDLLNDLQADQKLNELQSKNVQESLLDYDKKKKLSTEFVIEKSRAISNAFESWLIARKENDFGTYIPALEKIVDVMRRQADIIGFDDHPYDALLDDYEPGEKTANLDILFNDIKLKLTGLLEQITAAEQVDDSFMRLTYDRDKQWDLGIDLLRQMGYDLDAGRQDISPHPFTVTFSPHDVRVTTRIDENNFNNMTWSCIHEGGHALYEQGLLAEHYGLPAGSAISLGIHESQSRLWENNVGRSLNYWKANYDRVRSYFPENLANVDLMAFYKAMNKVEPTFIRTESDELTYHFHILIRFELEKALIDGTLQVKELREAWNTKYKDYLDIEVPSDNEGVLQDIHWSHGSFGYFPTYSLGSFYAAQFYDQARSDVPDLEEQIAAGNMKPLLGWLREHIHRHGRMYKAKELCRSVTGEELNVDHFMAYAKKKYAGIYGI